jgi:hypothetical protein
MLKVMQDEDLIVPRLGVSPQMTQQVQRCKLNILSARVEIADRAQFAYAFIVARSLRPDNVVEITKHTGEPCCGGSDKNPQCLSGRAAAIKVEGHESKRERGGAVEKLRDGFPDVT